MMSVLQINWGSEHLRNLPRGKEIRTWEKPGDSSACPLPGTQQGWKILPELVVEWWDENLYFLSQFWKACLKLEGCEVFLFPGNPRFLPPGCSNPSSSAVPSGAQALRSHSLPQLRKSCCGGTDHGTGWRQVICWFYCLCVWGWVRFNDVSNLFPLIQPNSFTAMKWTTF